MLSGERIFFFKFNDRNDFIWVDRNEIFQTALPLELVMKKYSSLGYIDENNIDVGLEGLQGLDRLYPLEGS